MTETVTETDTARIAILQQNSDFIAVDKPAGLPTIADRFGSDCVHAQLQAQTGERLWIVHRLDREVTGVLLFARTAAAHRALSMAFEGRQVAKTYEAWCEGPAPAWHTAHWENTLLRGKKRAYLHPIGKLAITDATFEGPAADGLSQRLLLRPLTGRSHQLRVHVAGVGLPVVGDGLYGANRPFRLAEIALRAVELRIAAGVLSATELRIEAPLLAI